MPRLIMQCLIMYCLIMSCFILSCLIRKILIMSCLIKSCLIMSCFRTKVEPPTKETVFTMSKLGWNYFCSKINKAEVKVVDNVRDCPFY